MLLFINVPNIPALRTEFATELQDIQNLPLRWRVNSKGSNDWRGWESVSNLLRSSFVSNEER